MCDAMTPPEVAQRLRVNAGKVLSWIRAGELPALNVATRPTGRPRYRISEADLLVFANRRAGAALPTPRRSKRRDQNVTEFF